MVHVVCFIMPLLSISYESLYARWLMHINEGDPVYCVAKQSELTQFKAVEVTEKRHSVLTAGKLGFVCLTGCLWTMDETDNTASEVMRGETLHLLSFSISYTLKTF